MQKQALSALANAFLKDAEASLEDANDRLIELLQSMDTKNVKKLDLQLLSKSIAKCALTVLREAESSPAMKQHKMLEMFNELLQDNIFDKVVVGSVLIPSLIECLDDDRRLFLIRRCVSTKLDLLKLILASLLNFY